MTAAYLSPKEVATRKLVLELAVQHAAIVHLGTGMVPEIIPLANLFLDFLTKERVP